MIWGSGVEVVGVSEVICDANIMLLLYTVGFKGLNYSGAVVSDKVQLDIITDTETSPKIS